jgi:gliding motility-associated-like protein
MKKTVLFKTIVFVVLLCGPLLQAQWQNGLWTEKQANNWYFGLNAGLNFETSPPTALVDSQMIASEGSGTISDAEGNLLFYTDGVTVWNKDHQVMENGTGLLGTGDSTTQNGLIIPIPNSIDRYYIFTIEGFGGSNGLRYSEVDMSLDDGMGAVTENKNILLQTPMSEKMTAVYHSDGEQVWVIFHKGSFFSYSNEFYAYLVTPDGLSSAPVISAIGSIHGMPFGQLKVSPDGSKLASVGGLLTYFNVCEVFDFNNATGEISNPVDLTSAVNMGSYSIEFSPNNRFLYVPPTNYQPIFYQFDLDAGDEEAILNSAVALSDVPAYSSLQLAPDGKIYVSDGSLNDQNLLEYISVINYPNNKGLAAGLEDEVIDLSPGTFTGSSGWALTGFIQSYFESGLLYEGVNCARENVTFFTLRIPGITSIVWDFGDPDSGEANISNEPVHAFSNGGTYTVTATITSNGAEQTTTTEITILPAPAVVLPIVQNLIKCANDEGTAIFDLTGLNAEILNGLDTELYSVSYYVSEDDIVLDNPIVDTETFTTEGQVVYVKISNNETGCFTIISFELIIKPLPMAAEPGNLELCGGTTGTAIFNLAQQDTVILGNQDPDTFTVVYFAEQEDIISGNIITDPANFTSAGQIVYATVVNTITGCVSPTVEFNLIVTGPAIMAEVLTLTDCSPFDLGMVTPQLAQGLALSYYTSEEDAVNAANAIIEFTRYDIEALAQTLYVRAEDIERCTEIYTLNLELAICEIPRGISPNGDQLNDAFDLSNFDVAKLEIFNRYGQQVYAHSNYTTEWHGQADNGNELPTGTYYYMVQFKDGESKTGWVYINRQQ